MPEQPSIQCGSFIPCSFPSSVAGETQEQRIARVNCRIKRLSLVAMIYGASAFRSPDYDFSQISKEDIGHIQYLLALSKSSYANRLDKTINMITDENTKSRLRIAAWENYESYQMYQMLQNGAQKKAEKEPDKPENPKSLERQTADVPEEKKRIGFFSSKPPKTRLSRDEKDRLLGWKEFIERNRKNKWYMCDTYGNEVYFTGKTILEAGLMPKDVQDLLNQVPGAQMSPPVTTFVPGKEKGYTVKADLFFSKPFHVDKELGLVGMYMFHVDHAQMYESNYLVSSQTVLWDKKNNRLKPMGPYHLKPMGGIDWKATFEGAGSFWYEEELQASYKAFQRQTPIDLPYDKKDFLAAGWASKKEEERERPSWLWSTDDE